MQFYAFSSQFSRILKPFSKYTDFFSFFSWQPRIQHARALWTDDPTTVPYCCSILGIILIFPWIIKGNTKRKITAANTKREQLITNFLYLLQKIFTFLIGAGGRVINTHVSRAPGLSWSQVCRACSSRDHYDERKNRPLKQMKHKRQKVSKWNLCRKMFQNETKMLHGKNRDPAYYYAIKTDGLRV